MVARIEMKLGTHTYHIISMTTTCFHDDFEQQQYPQALLLKLANDSTH